MDSARVNELDLLRFLAAFAVVLFHYGFRRAVLEGAAIAPYPSLGAEYGFLGVHLFFLISGFVILMTADGASLRGFVVSRAARLYPAFWVCCTLTFAVLLATGAGRQPVSVGQYLANMTMLSGFVGIPSIDSVYWSLFVELKFYALVAVILLLGRIHQAGRFLAAWLLACAILAIHPIGLLCSVLVTDYAPYFIAGATAFLVWAHGWSARRGAMFGLAWLLALHGSSNEIQEFQDVNGIALNGAVVMAIITGYFAIMALIALRRTGVFAKQRWARLGAITYPLYLLHQNIGYALFKTAGPGLHSHLLFWGVTAGMLGAAYAVHVAVERPLAGLLREGLRTALGVPRSERRIQAGIRSGQP